MLIFLDKKITNKNIINSEIKPLLGIHNFVKSIFEKNNNYIFILFFNVLITHPLGAVCMGIKNTRVVKIAIESDRFPFVSHFIGTHIYYCCSIIYRCAHSLNCAGAITINDSEGDIINTIVNKGMVNFLTNY